MAYFRAGGQRPSGNAALTDVKAGRTFSNDEDVDLVGSMPDNGAINKTLNTSSTSYTIPEGYHDGNGKVKITTQTKTVTATTSAQNVAPDSGKVLSKVTINPQNHTGTYSPTNRAAALDMGANNNYRYVNTNGVPNSNSGTYTFAANDTGGTKDLGETNTYRHVNATNVYNKGLSDGSARIFFTMAGVAAYFFVKIDNGIANISNPVTGNTLDNTLLFESQGGGYSANIKFLKAGKYCISGTWQTKAVNDVVNITLGLQYIAYYKDLKQH